MKLATFSTPDNALPRVGVRRDDTLVDLSTCSDLPATMKDLLATGIDAQAITSTIEGAEGISLDDVTLHAPVPNPGKVLALGLNYADHVAEGGMEIPEQQVWFNKQHNCINGPYGDINLPAVSTMLDYEAELCVIIGKRCKHVPKERAHEVIGGYCCGNDVSVRDWQLRVPTWQIGKSFDTHGPIGPYLVTADELGDPHNLDIRCLVNGEERQHSNTKHLIFNCFDAIEHLSQAFTLDVGDVLFMGTPAGVGVALQPPVFLKTGDVVRVEIDKLGYLENKVVPEIATPVIG